MAAKPDKLLMSALSMALDLLVVLLALLLASPFLLMLASPFL